MSDGSDGDAAARQQLAACNNTHGPVDPDTRSTDSVPCLLSKRWTFTYGFFFTLVILYVTRVNLSLAIVCMVDFPSDNAVQGTVDDISSGNGSASISEVNVSKLTISKSHVNINTTVDYNHSKDQTVGTAASSGGSCMADFGSPLQDIKWQPELHWTKGEVSFLLSCYFYGYIVTQLPGGLWAEKFGGRNAVACCLIFICISTFLTPVLSRTDLYLTMAVRVLGGLAAGAVIPALISMTSYWAPATDRAKMTSFGMSGGVVGVILAYLTSGFLCAYGFDRGWASIFYIDGILTALMICYWCWEVHSTPDTHPRITVREKEYIQSSNNQKLQQAYKTPWKAILTSLPMFACSVAHFAFNWSFFTTLINLPMFLKEVLYFDVTQNGIYSSLPYMFMGVSIQGSAHLADLLIARKTLGVLATRRLFTCSSLVGTALCLVCTGFVTCEYRLAAVALLCLSSVCGGLSFGGLFVNHIEIAGVFSGTAYGITNAIGGITGFITPVVVGVLTPNGLQSEWRNVFYLAAAISGIGAGTYLAFSSVSLQPWAMVGTSDVTVVVANGGECVPLSDKKEASTPEVEEL